MTPLFELAVLLLCILCVTSCGLKSRQTTNIYFPDKG